MHVCYVIQKYWCHRKHMLVREAEAASWTQRRQRYAAAVKRPDSNAWTVPTIGFPPPPPPPPPASHFGRPLHVWGHPTPTVDSPQVPMWPRHHLPRTPAPPWATAPPPPSDPAAFWHHNPYMRVCYLGIICWHCLVNDWFSLHSDLIISISQISIFSGTWTYAGPSDSNANAGCGKCSRIKLPS
jgi:hypothetical protein